MSPLNHKRTTSSLAPPIFYVAKNQQWGAFYLFIAEFFATLNIGGAKELVVPL